MDPKQLHHYQLIKLEAFHTTPRHRRSVHTEFMSLTTGQKQHKGRKVTIRILLCVHERGLQTTLRCSAVYHCGLAANTAKQWKNCGTSERRLQTSFVNK
uniref:Uncharacterized protein n=1 Tax=Caenorhabditis japonica TaxID=281687 RepID=A0A8R1EUM2_CAEJA